jgi:hypothetical protein
MAESRSTHGASNQGKNSYRNGISHMESSFHHRKHAVTFIVSCGRVAM